MNDAMTETQKGDHAWDVLCHLSALAMFTPIPFGNIVGPLVVWLVKRGDSPSVDEHGKESLNFQISLSLYVLLFAAATIGLMFLLIGFLMLPLLIGMLCIGPFLDLIFIILASIRASQGEVYRYPLTIRFLG